MRRKQRETTALDISMEDLSLGRSSDRANASVAMVTGTPNRPICLNSSASSSGSCDDGENSADNDRFPLFEISNNIRPPVPAPKAKSTLFADFGVKVHPDSRVNEQIIEIDSDVSEKSESHVIDFDAALYKNLQIQKSQFSNTLKNQQVRRYQRLRNFNPELGLVALFTLPP